MSALDPEIERRRALLAAISDMMTFVGATLTEHQENVLYEVIKALDLKQGEKK